MEICNNSLVKRAINTTFLKVVILIILFVILYGTNNVYVYYTSLMAFGVGVVFALFYIGFNGHVLGTLYLLSYILADFSMVSILIALNVVLVLSTLQMLLDKDRIKIRKIIIFATSLFAQVVYLIVNLGDGKQNLALVVSIILGQLFLFASLTFLDATIGRGMLSKINIDEKICGSVILIVFIIGMCSVNMGIVSIGLAISYIIILVTSFLFTSGLSMVIGGLVGIGYSIFYLNPIHISLFVVMSLLVSSFKCRFRFVSTIAGVLGYISFSLIFNLGLSVGEVVGLCLGGVVLCIIPKSTLQSLIGIVGDKRIVAIQNVFNKVKSQIVNRVKELSKVFAEMDGVYRDMVKGSISDDDAKKMLKEELILDVCSKCSNFNNCFRTSGTFMDNWLDNIIAMGYEKGKVTLIDLPEYITSNCNKVNAVVQHANSLIATYNDYSTSINNLDTSRLLIADQLSGVNGLLSALGKDVDIDVSFGSNYEKLIKENLAYVGVNCIESVIYKKGGENSVINLIVNKINVNAKNIVKTVNKTLKSRFKIATIEDCEIVGASSIVLTSVSKYDIAFGCATSTKTGSCVSGDTHMVVDLGDGKYMVSICDGMGSGNSASKISRLTISLIENFYRAGFDNDIILSSVNKLLSLNEQENFSTIDLCVVDCKKGIYDFIKLGATSGYIKHSNGDIEEVIGSGLPVGVLEDIRPHITKKFISSMDMLVFVSDGVSDVLGNNMIGTLRNLDSINPQTLSEEILKIALDKNGGVALDDMTVLCVRVFENV